MEPVTLAVIAVLAIEVPWSMRCALRITRRYRVRLVDSRIFRFLTRAVLLIAFGVGGAIGLLCVYTVGRALDWWPPMPTGLFSLLLGATLIGVVSFPIGVDREMSRAEKGVLP